MDASHRPQNTAPRACRHHIAMQAICNKKAMKLAMRAMRAMRPWRTRAVQATHVLPAPPPPAGFDRCSMSSTAVVGCLPSGMHRPRGVEGEGIARDASAYARLPTNAP